MKKKHIDVRQENNKKHIDVRQDFWSWTAIGRVQDSWTDPGVLDSYRMLRWRSDLARCVSLDGSVFLQNYD